MVEGLHGHNYYIEVELSGKPNRENMIYDFISLDKLLKKLISEWDHCTLLPRHNKKMTFMEKGSNIDIEYNDRFYSIPRHEVKFLECNNITTETLAQLLAKRLESYLNQEEKVDNITELTVVIWETPIYSASHTIHLKDH